MQDSGVSAGGQGGSERAHSNLLLLAGAVLAWTAFAPLLGPAQQQPARLTLTPQPTVPPLGPLDNQHLSLSSQPTPATGSLVLRGRSQL